MSGFFNFDFLARLLFFKPGRFRVDMAVGLIYSNQNPFTLPWPRGSAAPVLFCSSSITIM